MKVYLQPSPGKLVFSENIETADKFDDKDYAQFLALESFKPYGILRVQEYKNGFVLYKEVPDAVSKGWQTNMF